MARVELVMGMPIALDVRDGVEAAVEDAVFDWLRQVDSTFSTYRADSEIARLNAGRLAEPDASPDVREVLDRCRALRDETRGYFDAWAPRPRDGEVPRPPGSVDPSGFVKGWAVDRAARILDAAGCRNYALDAGGDIRLRGGALPAYRWRVGIRHPHAGDRVAAVVESDGLAVATSGAYNRGDHVVNPLTGRAASGLLSVTITGPDLATADAYATAAFAMGRAAGHWVARLRGGYEAMLVQDDETVLFTPGFPRVQVPALTAPTV